MNSQKLSKIIAKGAISFLNTALRFNANTTSCVIVYQPKLPKELDRFNRIK
ncbi:cyclic lactone autoinducer peptide [Anaerosacchariphilus polymeriproducens]|uniref:Cyclic lactone autoinducer peptide n=1 Tax=Anaerosacchariphilus polymeriproducens TaxID=1812858 RepID=A0A371AZ73_9FIRM|nr:cyclic lactone autoinducer peptide [Anaerosacchariphilus polymeriproducens]RDU24894.1 cyclic lactone autoinducer peptide [Anaerosacchariphilus polymeriproducens]